MLTMANTILFTNAGRSGFIGHRLQLLVAMHALQFVVL